MMLATAALWASGRFFRTHCGSDISEDARRPGDTTMSVGVSAMYAITLST